MKNLWKIYAKYIILYILHLPEVLFFQSVIFYDVCLKKNVEKLAKWCIQLCIWQTQTTRAVYPLHECIRYTINLHENVSATRVTHITILQSTFSCNRKRKFLARAAIVQTDTTLGNTVPRVTHVNSSHVCIAPIAGCNFTRVCVCISAHVRLRYMGTVLSLLHMRTIARICEYVYFYGRVRCVFCALHPPTHTRKPRRYIEFIACPAGPLP